MKALDTNTLVRLLVGDDQTQLKRLVRRMDEAQAAGDTFHVPSAVWIETIWVLSKAYGYSRREVVTALAALLTLNHFTANTRRFLQTYVKAATETKLDLPDLVIGIAAAEHGCDGVLTFDRKANRSRYFEAV